MDLMTNIKNIRKYKMKKDEKMDESQKRVKIKVDQVIMYPVKVQKADDMHLHDCVQQAIQISLQEDKEEMGERNRRKPIAIIHGLRESPSSSNEDKKAEEAIFSKPYIAYATPDRM